MTSNWLWKSRKEREDRSNENPEGNRQGLSSVLSFFKTLSLLLQLFYLWSVVYRRLLQLRDKLLNLWATFQEIFQELRERWQRPCPAPQASIDRLPTAPVVESMQEDGKAVCLICQATVLLGTEVTLLPCQHWFHTDCIKPWLLQQGHCPYCFRDIRLPPLEPQVLPSLKPQPNSPPTDTVPQPAAADTAIDLGGIDAASSEEDEDYDADVDAGSDEEFDGEDIFIYR